MELEIPHVLSRVNKRQIDENFSEKNATVEQHRRKLNKRTNLNIFWVNRMCLIRDGDEEKHTASSSSSDNVNDLTIQYILRIQ